MSGNAVGNISGIPSFPRYTNITSHNIQSLTTTTATIKWTTDAARDWTQYSLNDGPWTDAYDNVSEDLKSGVYTLNNLLPNTDYKVRIRVKRVDSQLWTESGYLYFKTSSKTAKIKVNGQLKEATPYIGKNGKWNVANVYIGKNNEWKRGK